MPSRRKRLREIKQIAQGAISEHSRRRENHTLPFLIHPFFFGPRKIRKMMNWVEKTEADRVRAEQALEEIREIAGDGNG